ncbi:MAG: heparinase II/III-family protein [Nitrospira sp.]|nr:heparinase II/III-family protein [Nitrospira sp.]
MRVTLSFKTNLLPRKLEASAKALAAGRPEDWWDGARERGLFSLFRLQRQLGSRWLSRSFTDQDVAAASFCRSAYPVLPSLPWQCDLNPASVEDLLNGRLSVFGVPWQWTTDEACWHHAVDTGRTWPRRFFPNIAIQPGNSCGDVRLAWEPSRLQHLVTLGLIAQKADPSVRSRAVAAIEAQFVSWVAANPLLIGIHYISPMECALRLLASCYALDLIRPWMQQPRQTWGALLALVSGHAELIRKRLALRSPVPHETLAGAAALIHAGSLFTEMEQAERWLAFGLYLIEEDTPRHISQDGGSQEQGLGYLQFSTDLYGLIVAMLDHQQRPLSEKVRQAFDRSRAFLDEFRSPADDRLPTIGDGSCETALSPSLRFPNPGRRRTSGLTTFHLSGYSIIRGRDSHRAIFDHGPLGLPPRYAHGHADALSMILQIGPQEVFIDPGTYTYLGEDAWRSYFRGTRGHNTVTVDGVDQAVPEGALTWSHPFDTHLVYRDETPEGKTTVIARHYGYKERLGVVHLRGVSYEPSGSWIIWDWLTGTGTHHLELNWHLGCQVVAVEGGYRLEGLDRPLLLTIEGGASRLHTGSTQPVAGWRSSRYGSKDPITTIRVEHHGPLSHEFMTRIRPL